MSLADVQECLVKLARGDNYSPAATALTLTEKEWLLQVQKSKGLAITEQIQSWWRLGRLQIAAPFTVGLLTVNHQQDIIIDYIHCQPVRTLFFAAEIEQFRQFLHSNNSIDKLTRSTIAFECALKNATQLISEPGQDTRKAELPWHAKLERSAGVIALEFDRNPLEVFHALLTGKPLPVQSSKNHYIIVAPQLPDLWRFALATEFLLLTSNVDFFALRHSGDATTRALIYRMIREGILRQ